MLDDRERDQLPSVARHLASVLRDPFASVNAALDIRIVGTMMVCHARTASRACFSQSARGPFGVSTTSTASGAGKG